MLTAVLSEDLSSVHRFFVIGVALLLAGCVYYFGPERRIRQASDSKARRMLNTFIFPKIEQKAKRALPDGAASEFRFNVMLYRYRDRIPNSERKLYPFHKSLKIEFYDGDYEQTGEVGVKWRPDEGLCGKALSSNKMFVQKLDFQHREEWNMTREQFGLTGDVGSVISIPVYADEDEEKESAIGVLNLDTKQEIDEEKLQQLGEDIRIYAKYIGWLL